MARLSTLFPAVILLAASLLLGGMAMAAPQEQADVVAVLFPPWIGERARMEIVARAEAMPVRSGAFPFLWVVRSRRPGLPDRLRRAGAVMLLNPESAWGCLTDESENGVQDA